LRPTIINNEYSLKERIMTTNQQEYTPSIGKRANLIARLLGATSAIGLAAPLTWIGYSAFGIDHDLPLSEALDAPRKTINGHYIGQLSYYAKRRGSGRPLVLIHSINAGSSAYEMKPLFDSFCGQRPIYAPDLPGFGFSERSDRHYTPELYTTAILALLDDIEQVAGGVDVVALSLSGEFAARAAQRRPELFHSLTLISPSGFAATQELNRTEQAARNQTSEQAHRIFTFPLWSQAIYDLLVTKPTIAYYLKRSFVGPINDELLAYDYATSHQSGARFAPLAFISGALFTPSIRQTIYTALDLPVLVLYDQDAFVGFDELPAFLEQHPHWQATRITPSRGLPHFEQRAQTITALTSFWDAL
jgi:pimeloyl-ACP methyl ester carboxylesterase